MLPSAFFPDSLHHIQPMTNSLIPISIFVCAAFSVIAEAPRNDDLERILHDGIWCCLHDLHGGAPGISAFADRMEKEWGVSKSRFADLLLETARNEREDRFARKNAIVRFCELAPAEDFPKVSEFFSNTNSELRLTALRNAIVRFPDVSDRVGFARERLDWLQAHPEFRHDAYTIMIAFYNGMVSSGATDEYKDEVLTFYREEAGNPRFGENAYAVLLFLNRHDPSWKTNECRVELLRRWRDDPSLPEDVRNFMRATSTNSLVSSETTDARGVKTEEISPSSAESPTISCNTDSSAKVSSPDGDRPAAMASSRLARIVGVTALLAVALVLVFRRRRR